MTSRPELHPSILEYYSEGREDGRLRTGDGRLEFWRTQDVLGRVLPGTLGRLLDVGGGTGIHAAWLTESDPALVGVSGHLLTVARRPE